MSHRTPFVLLSALITLLLGAVALVNCYTQEAARDAQRHVLQRLDGGEVSVQLACTPVVVELPRVNP